MRDPVCGCEVDKGDRVTYEGHLYAFCCATCRWAFEQDPDSYTK